MSRLGVLFILISWVLASCVAPQIEPKRLEPEEQGFRPDHFNHEYLDTHRNVGDESLWKLTKPSFGVSLLSEKCGRLNFGGASGNLYSLASSCSYEWMVRFKILCEVSQDMAIHVPLKYRELKIDAKGIKDLKDPKRFPVILTTDAEGVLQFIFSTNSALENVQFVINYNDHVIDIPSTSVASLPVVLSVQACLSKAENE